jgi:hypothetical protein
MQSILNKVLLYMNIVLFDGDLNNSVNVLVYKTINTRSRLTNNLLACEY